MESGGIEGMLGYKEMREGCSDEGRKRRRRN